MIDFAGLAMELGPGRILREGVRRALARPGQVHLSITDRCNSRCLHCDIWKKARSGEMEIEQWMKVVDELRDWLGPFTLKIAGGEPLVKCGVLDLVSHAKRLGCHTGLSTNGLAVDDETARRIVESGLDEIHVSLESARPDHHDHIRNQPGAFAQTVSAIQRLNRARTGLHIYLATVIVEENLDDLMGIVSFVRDNGLRTVHFQPLYQNFGQTYDPAWYARSPHFPRSLEKLDAVIDELIRVQESEWLVGNSPNQLRMMKVYFRDPNLAQGGECMAGKRDLAFDPYGHMLLCFWMEGVGNVREGRVRVLYGSAAAKVRRREVRACKRNCNILNCNYDRDLFQRIQDAAPRRVARQA